MSSPQHSLDLADTRDRLRVLHDVLAVLNRSANVRWALNEVLERILAALGLETGWIVLQDPAAMDPVAGPGFALAAHAGIPPAMGLDHHAVWEGNCTCEHRCQAGVHEHAYNVSSCPRVVWLSRELQRDAVHASVPLRLDGRTLGMLNVASADWRPLDDATLRFLEKIGEELGDAIGRSRVHEQLLAQRVAQQNLMLELSRALLGAQGLAEIARVLLERARDVMKTDAAALLLPDPDGRTLRFRGIVGWRDDPAAQGRTVPRGAGDSIWMALWARRPALLDNVSAEPAAPPWLRAEEFHTRLIVPMLAEARTMGALVLDMRRARAFEDDELDFAQLLANTAALAVQAEHRREEAAHQVCLERELDAAHEIQATLLPQPHIAFPGWDMEAIYEPAEAVGGDFFDVVPLKTPANHVALLCGDVAGKSMSGALLMASSLSAFHGLIHVEPDPAAVLEAVNERLRRRISNDRFVTAFYGVLDMDSGRLHYARAGHPPALVLRADPAGGVVWLTGPGAALALLESTRSETREVQLQPGDALVLYSDGVTEALTHEFASFDESRLEAAVAGARGLGAEAIVERIVESVRAWRAGAKPSDDLTLLVARRAPA